MKVVDALPAVLGLAALAHGHMEMTSPPPFRSKHNPNAGSNVDYSNTAPLSASGSDFPCKGYHKLLGTPEGAPVATWTAGQKYDFTIAGGANHAGGSCQASLSFDKGQSWKVIHSYIGKCPPPGESTHSFALPGDTPNGEALFGWTWFNQIGNREMYMNCAAVTITGGKNKRGGSGSFSSRPDILVGNVGNGVCTYESRDVEFPNPGPDVTRDSKATAPPGKDGCKGQPADSGSPPPSGGNNDGSGSGSSSGSSSSSQASSSHTTSAYTSTSAGNAQTSATAPPAVFVTSGPSPTTKGDNGTFTAATQTSVAKAPSSTAPGNGSSSINSGSTPGGTPCDQDGQWNCLPGGTQYQRCASGAWTQPMPVAPGTTCKTGKSNDLVLNKRGGSFWRRDGGGARQ